MDKTVAFVPFRSGSKGIKNKNIKEFNGVPLFKVVIEELIKVPKDILHKIVIATDYSKEEIIPLLTKDSRLEFWNRKLTKSISDEATTEEVIFEYLCNNNLIGYNYMLLVQITNPMIKSYQVEKAIKEYNKIGTLFSVVKFSRYLWTEKRKLLGYETRLRRQEMDDTYLENGSFYLFNITQLCITSNRINEPISFFEMPLESSFEIDSEEDWKIIEKLHKFP